MNKTATKTKLSHIALMRTEGCITQQVIREKLNLTDLQYGNMVYETGLEFLQSIYPDVLKEYREQFEASKMFWKWWKNEWALWEQAFMSFAYNDAITAKFYLQWMQAAASSSNATASFSTLLKIIKDVKA